MRSELLEQTMNVEQQVLLRIAFIARPDSTAINERSNKWDRCLIVHYQHGHRLATFKRDVHQLWNETFKGIPIQDIRLIVGNREVELH